MRNAFVTLVLCLSVLVAGWTTTATAQSVSISGGPAFFEADTIVYNETTDIVTARGSVEIVRGGVRLMADTISYDLGQDLISADGNVVVIDPDGTAIFVDSFTLQGGLLDGLADDIDVLLADSTRIEAASGRREGGNILRFKDVLYSPCRPCTNRTTGEDEEPTWQIRARDVVHDKDEKEIQFEDVTFEIGGFPILYLPALTQPDPTVRRKSGLLPPTFKTSSVLGVGYTQPYFVNLAPNRDLTLLPTFTTKEGAILGAEYRHLTENGRFGFEGSVTYASESSGVGTSSENRFRGHLFGTGRFDLENDKHWGYDLEFATDDSYLQRYEISDEILLHSSVFLDRIWDLNYAAVSANAFRGQRTTDNQDRIPLVLPEIDASYRSGELWLGSYATADAGLVSLLRDEGISVQRLSGDVRWTLPFTGSFGDLWSLDTSLRADAYAVHGDARTGVDNGDTDLELRITPRLTLEGSLPLIGETFGLSTVIEPLVMLTMTTNDGADPDIPNEDSIDFEFDDTNLFNANRATGLDLVERGGQLAYGVRFAGEGRDGLRIDGLLGQNYRIYGDATFGSETGLEKRRSDFVGRIGISPGPLLDLDYRFRIDRETLRPARTEIQLSMGEPDLRFDLGYLALTDEPGQSGFTRRKEAVAGVYAKVNGNLSFSLRSRRDLTENRTINTSIGFIWHDETIAVLGGIERDFTRLRDAEPSTTFALRIALRNLGAIGTSSGGLFETN